MLLVDFQLEERRRVVERKKTQGFINFMVGCIQSDTVPLLRNSSLLLPKGYLAPTNIGRGINEG